ncbi:MAG: glycosyltransferase family 4 protein [Pseudomonadota bacterium]|nr:glycosyltransferase family 4 protein [Pseudomonadota bacterium]
MSSDPKNILFFSSFGNLRWGGQRSLYHLVTRLDRGDRYRPIVLLPTDEDLADALRARGVEVVIHELPPLRLINHWAFLSSVRYLSRLVATRNISLMHTDGPRNTLYAGFVARKSTAAPPAGPGFTGNPPSENSICRRKSIPVVFHVRASDRDRYDRIIYGCATRIILVAESLRSRFDWVRDDSKFRTIYNGVDLEQFDAEASAPPTIEARLLSDKEVMIVCTGRVEPQKGQHDLVEACASLKAAGVAFRLLLAGETTDKAYLEKCRCRAQELQIDDQVAFVGHIDNMPGLLRSADIFVLPSHGEAFSRAILEAMAAGKPVVATDVGGAREAIEEGVCGFLVPPGDTAALGDRLLLLAKNVSMRQRFGAAARRRLEERFTIELNILETEKLYAELLEGTPS